MNYTVNVSDLHFSLTLLQMFLSVFFAAVGVVGALYSFSVAAVGLRDGPLCKVLDEWTTPFKNRWQQKPFHTWHLLTWSVMQPLLSHTVPRATWPTPAPGACALSPTTWWSSTSHCLWLCWPSAPCRWCSVPFRSSTDWSAAAAEPARKKKK